MPTISIAIGALLILVGVIGYVHGAMNDRASITALIPAFFGLALASLGFVARTSEGLRKHLMHGAVAIALIGFILTAGRLISKFSELSASAAVVSQVTMSLLCLAFVILAVRSFAEARRNG